MKLIIYFTFILSVYALESVPVILSSHRVVKGLKSKKAFGEVHTGEEVTNLAKQLITECSSDEYILVNQPGLILEDLRIMEKDHWPFLRKYLAMSSTVLGIPRVNSVLDLAYLEKYIIKTCDAETIRVVNGDEEEVEQYYDVRTRVIQVQMPELPDAPRKELKEY